MKTALFALNIYILTLFACLAAPDAAPGPYDANSFTISPMVAYKTTEIGKTTGKFGGGLAVSYAPVDNIEIEAAAISYRVSDAPVVSSVDEASANFKGYLPLGKSGFAPYGIIGYTRDIKSDENLMNAGVGIAFRYSHVNAFADGVYQNSFLSHGNRFLLRAGFGVTF